MRAFTAGELYKMAENKGRAQRHFVFFDRLPLACRRAIMYSSNPNRQEFRCVKGICNHGDKPCQTQPGATLTRPSSSMVTNSPIQIAT